MALARLRAATVATLRLCQDVIDQWQTISTLDPALNKALGGGIPVGYLTEVTGERSGMNLERQIMMLMIQ